MDSVFRRGKTVVSELQVTLRVDQTHSPQVREMSRYSGLGEPKNLNDIADTQLAGGEEAQYSDSSWVGKTFEDSIEVIDRRYAWWQRGLPVFRSARLQCHICHNAYNMAGRI